MSAASARGVDRGAVAVEFALVLPVLMLFLFGIIQYGYGLYQLQAFNSALSQASRQAGTGISDCTEFSGQLRTLMSANGLPAETITDIRVDWLDSNGAVIDTADRTGHARVTATYQPFRIGVPFIPFPETITRSRTALVQDIGLNNLSLPIGGCS